MINLDNAATGIKKPKEVIEAVNNALLYPGNPGRGVNAVSIQAGRGVYHARKVLAEFFNAENPSCVIFTGNATEGLNTAIFGVLKPGDNAITTPMEHNSVLRPLYVQRKRGVEVSFVRADKDGKLVYEDFDDLIKHSTKAIIVTHISNLTGNLYDIERIGEIARKRGLIFIVDASQSAGVFPIDVQKLNIDILVASGHKGMQGPQGTGIMVVSQDIDIIPLKVGGSGINTYSKTHPSKIPEHLEAGTLNTPGIAGLMAGALYIKEFRMDNIRNKEIELTKLFYSYIKKLNDIMIYGDFTDFNRGSIVCLNVRGMDSDTVGDILYSKYNISVRTGGHCAPLAHESIGTKKMGAVRFSFSHFNNISDVESAVTALKEIVNGKNS